MTELCIDDGNLSVAWARAVQIADASPKDEAVPLVVSISGFDTNGNFTETPAIRSAVDALLLAKQKQPVDTVANTIFPRSLWNSAQPRAALFKRYAAIAHAIKVSSHKNQHGIYFERMISGGPQKNANQLDFIIDTFTKRKGARRSAMQLALFDPGRDHTSSAMRGFPCLQHVAFAASPAGLSVTAFYASQYLIERGYGNYVGLCRLGQFVAHELKIKLARLTCLIGIAQREHAIPGALRKQINSAVSAATKAV